MAQEFFQILISVETEEQREKILAHLVEGEEENILDFGFNTKLKESDNVYS